MQFDFADEQVKNIQVTTTHFPLFRPCHLSFCYQTRPYKYRNILHLFIEQSFIIKTNCFQINLTSLMILTSKLHTV